MRVLEREKVGKVNEEKRDVSFCVSDLGFRYFIHKLCNCFLCYCFISKQGYIDGILLYFYRILNF